MHELHGLLRPHFRLLLRELGTPCSTEHPASPPYPLCEGYGGCALIPTDRHCSATTTPARRRSARAARAAPPTSAAPSWAAAAACRGATYAREGSNFETAAPRHTPTHTFPLGSPTPAAPTPSTAARVTALEARLTASTPTSARAGATNETTDTVEVVGSLDQFPSQPKTFARGRRRRGTGEALRQDKKSSARRSPWTSARAPLPYMYAARLLLQLRPVVRVVLLV